MMKDIMTLILGTILLTSGTHAATKDPVPAALRDVAETRAEHYHHASRLLEDLASPSQLVVVEPDLKTLATGKGPVAMMFDEAAVQECRRRVALCETLPRKPRVRAGIISLGISGIRVEDIKGAPAFPVVGVEEGAPAQGALKAGDVIVGANGRLFPATDDPRVHMGYALAAAQTPGLDGVLTLQLVSDGKPLNIPVTLGVSNAYGAGWPYRSPECGEMLKQAQDFLIERTPDQVGGIGFKTQTYGNILLLMAMENDEALDLARRLLSHTLPPHRVAKLGGYGLASWMRGYELIAQAEYYLLTGDSSVLPGIENRAQVIADGQAPSGTWGHGLPCRGYGEVNAAGAACFLGLALARECGVSFNEEALAKAIRFFAKYAGGTVPYGNHTIEFRGSNNGTASIVAIAFDILGEQDLAERFARYVAYTYRAREMGHAENIFSHSWGPIAARRAPEAEFRMFMDNTLWMFELERTPWGGLWQIGKRACGSLTATTGPIGLFLGLPEARLRVLGAPRSVFGTEPPTEQARKAVQCYRDKDWTAFNTAAEACLAEGASAAEKDYARQLLAAYKRMEHHAASVIALAAGNIEAKRLHKARQQIQCLEMMLGGERPETAALKEQLATDEARKLLAGGPPSPPDLPTREEENLPPREQQAKADVPPSTTPGEALPPAPFSDTPDDVVFRAMQDKAPAEIARYFSYPYQYGMVGAARAMAAHGAGAMPLLEKLLTSEHPALRRGAVMSIGYLCAAAKKQQHPEGSKTANDSIDMDRAIALIEDLATDPDEFVQLAVASTITMRGETPHTRQLLVALAGSRHPSAQTSALGIARRNYTDPETKVRISILVDTTAPEKNTVGQWEQSHFVLEQAKDHAEPALPALATYFNGWAYRLTGMFADSATVRAMNVINAQMDKDAVLVTIPGLCRTYMRITNSDHHGWVKCREMVLAALKKLAPRARPQIAAAVKAEKEYLSSVSDKDLLEELSLFGWPVWTKEVSEFPWWYKNTAPHGTPRDEIKARIAELEALLDKTGPGVSLVD